MRQVVAIGFCDTFDQVEDAQAFEIAREFAARNVRQLFFQISAACRRLMSPPPPLTFNFFFQANHLVDDFAFDDFAFEVVIPEHIIRRAAPRILLFAHLFAHGAGLPPQIAESDHARDDDEHQQHRREHQPHHNQGGGDDEPDQPA